MKKIFETFFCISSCGQLKNSKADYVTKVKNRPRTLFFIILSVDWENPMSIYFTYLPLGQKIAQCYSHPPVDIKWSKRNPCGFGIPKKITSS